jgi:hypothetical protein
MDIMMPHLHEQPAPAPWLIRCERIDAGQVIREAVSRTPDAGPDEINGELSKRDAAMPGPLVAEQMKKCDRPDT